MQRFNKRKTILLLLLALMLVFTSGTVPVSAASYMVPVNLPVRVNGVGCTVKIESTSYAATPITLDIAGNSTETLHFICKGVPDVSYHYDLTVENADTVDVNYDGKKYVVTVMIRPGGTGYTITADSGASGDEGKPIELAFTNYSITPYTPPVPVQHDPPVRKVIDGIPEVASEFVFTFTRNDIANPMPDGSIGGQKQMSVIGAGFAEFGIITFTEPGVYEYTIAEKNTGEKGYDYDPAVYIVRYDIKDAGGYLTAERTFFKDGVAVEYLTAATFTNKYEKPEDPVDDPGHGGDLPGDDTTPAPPDSHPDDTPKTGDDSNIALWTMIALGSFGLGSILLAVYLLMRRFGKNRTYA